jgi:hypothetical protein
MSSEANPSFEASSDGTFDAGVTAAIYRVIQTMGGESAPANTAVEPTPPAQAEQNPYVDRLLHRILHVPLGTSARLAAQWVYEQHSDPEELEEIGRMIQNSEIGRLYPELAVPPGFPAERPSVYFLPPDLSWFRIPTNSSALAMNRLIQENNLDAIPLLSVQETAQLIHFLQGNFPEDTEPEDRHRVLCQVVQNLICNLELHRITKNPDGVVIRFSDNPAEDISSSAYDFSDKHLGYVGMMHGDLYRHFRRHWITWWHRTNMDPASLRSRNTPRRQSMTSSLLKLEEDHLVSLDINCEGAIVAIRKQPPTS